ncbi:MAG: helicase-related protein, partial [Dehalococcoidia bacterium]
IDVTGISHVINFDLPDDPDSYVHRIGRTARAGASGHAITFCASGERATLRIVERLIGHRVPVGDARQYLAAAGPAPAPKAVTARPAPTEAQRANSRAPQQRRPARPRRPMANTQRR